MCDHGHEERCKLRSSQYICVTACRCGDRRLNEASPYLTLQGLHEHDEDAGKICSLLKTNCGWKIGRETWIQPDGLECVRAPVTRL